VGAVAHRSNPVPHLSAFTVKRVRKDWNAMKVNEIMTANVATVSQNVTLKEVAELMVERGVAGIPVTNAEGRVLGVVSEADIIVKVAGRPESAGIIGSILAPKQLDERRLAATTAGEAMTAPAVTIDAEQSVGEAARLMVERAVNRLPVLADGKLVGILSRADLVRAFVRPDGEVLEELRREVARRLSLAPEQLEIGVTGGRVRIDGHVETRIDAELIEAFAWRVPGVVAVDRSGLGWGDERVPDRDSG
jgi:CBS domain-containing protein